MEQQCECNISKSGRNLFAMIPVIDQDKFGKGDKVKVVLMEKSSLDPQDKKKIKAELDNFIKNPNGSKVKGNILGYPIEIPLAQILRNIPREKAEKILYEALLK